jgi:hypothetical protein
MAPALPPVATVMTGLAGHATVLAGQACRSKATRPRFNEPTIRSLRGRRLSVTARSRTGEALGLIRRHVFDEGGSR